eukprot:COSAG02_NODE_496_length_21109_cov_5.047025_3_plen_46_part_00
MLQRTDTVMQQQQQQQQQQQEEEEEKDCANHNSPLSSLLQPATNY